MPLAALNRPTARWVSPATAADTVAGLQSALGIGRLTAAILARRGFSDAAAAQEFLQPKLDALHDPSLMCDLDRATQRILAAIRASEPILIYGDYDVDGTISVVVLKKTIEILGGRAEYHIPHRIQEGYGMRAEVVERAVERGVRLVISVDTGIRSNHVVEHTKRLGIDVIVTDHHLPDGELPPAFAVLNPNRPDCRYPNKHLCGAGVTFKLIQSLLMRGGLTPARRSALLDSFLKPVAVATVADIVPLTGENRVIVHRGLSGLRDVRNPGLESLLAVAGLDIGESPTAHQVAFRIAPRINAAGRMADASDVIELFLTSDRDRARVIAEQLDGLNRERQATENEVLQAILAKCDEGFADDVRALVFAEPGWHLGVLGIVASRLVERFSRPVFVLSDAAHTNGDADCFSGSGRSIPGFHLLDAIETMPDLFTRFGGHSAAAGVTLRCDLVDDFRRRFGDVAAARLTADDLRPRYEIDAEAAFQELTERSIREVLSLGPFGFGNPSPILRAMGVEVAGPPKESSSGKQLTIGFRHDGRTLFLKAWDFAERGEILRAGAKLDILFQIEDDPSGRKRGYGSWCLRLKDAVLHGSAD